MKTVGAGEQVPFGERLSQPGTGSSSRWKITRWAVLRSGCGSASSSSQVRSGKRRTRSLTDSPRPGELVAGESTAFPGVRPDAPQGLAIPGLTPQAPVLGPQRVDLCPRDQDHVIGVCGHVNSSPPQGMPGIDFTRHEPPGPQHAPRTGWRSLLLLGCLGPG